MALGTSTPFFDRDQSGIGRATLMGTLVATVVIWSFLTLVALWAGAHVAEALAMGGCAAFFGGPGFGGMLGAVLYVERQHAVSAAHIGAPDRPDTPRTAPIELPPVAPAPEPIATAATERARGLSSKAQDRSDDHHHVTSGR
jgi:hypothetical protein